MILPRPRREGRAGIFEVSRDGVIGLAEEGAGLVLRVGHNLWDGFGHW